MKPGLFVLPLEVWIDVFVFLWITREKMAEIVDKIGNRDFAEKLQFRLHDMGKHALHFLLISSKPVLPCKFRLTKRKARKWSIRKIVGLFSIEKIKHFKPERQACLAVRKPMPPSYKKCKFPKTEMPENITKFQEIFITWVPKYI